MKKYGDEYEIKSYGDLRMMTPAAEGLQLINLIGEKSSTKNTKEY